jgi:hypothetical protein
MIDNDMLAIKPIPMNPKRRLFCISSESEQNSISKTTDLSLKDTSKPNEKEAAAWWDSMDVNTTTNMCGGKPLGLSHDGLRGTSRNVLAIKDKNITTCSGGGCTFCVRSWPTVASFWMGTRTFCVRR